LAQVGQHIASLSTPNGEQAAEDDCPADEVAVNLLERRSARRPRRRLHVEKQQESKRRYRNAATSRRVDSPAGRSRWGRRAEARRRAGRLSRRAKGSCLHRHTEAPALDETQERESAPRSLLVCVRSGSASWRAHFLFKEGPDVKGAIVPPSNCSPVDEVCSFLFRRWVSADRSSELPRLLNSMQGRQAARRQEELAGAGWDAPPCGRAASWRAARSR
jgi:hypothetical protein